MTSKVFTREMLTELEAKTAAGFAVTIGDVEFSDLRSALLELDAIYDRREAIAVESMRQYRADRSSKSAMAPARIAEAAQTEAANAILNAVGMPELATS